jgi:CubicO group peptidase (beta-lactamase class C family)
MNRRALLFVGICLLLPPALRAAELPEAQPEQVGLSSERLARITHFFETDTANKRLPGAVLFIARGGKLAYHRAFGMRDTAEGTPMAENSIFRIYSMTKPVTAVAVLMLLEEGKLRLTDPVSRYIPAFKGQQVLVERMDAAGRRIRATVPVEREVTIQDLLRHTSGITYGLGGSEAERLYAENGLRLNLAAKDNALTTKLTDMQVAERIGKLPLMFQPGTSWEYGRGIDVALAVVEAISGQRADRFFEERIFRPLGMVDTAFNLPPEKLSRVAQPAADPGTGQTAALTDVAVPRTFLGGGEGLLSTARDYVRFCQMLLNGGELDGVRLLSRKTVELMVSDHIGPTLATAPTYAPGPGYGFGLSVAVRIAPGMSAIPGSVHEFNWGGAAGTTFWVDPDEKLVALMLIQAPEQRLYYRYAFRSLVYQSFAD